MRQKSKWASKKRFREAEAEVYGEGAAPTFKYGLYKLGAKTFYLTDN